MWRRAAAAVSPWIRSPSPRTGPQFPPHRLIHEGKVGTASERRPFISFVLGGPGSGKGTQCVKIAETFGFEHLSAGDLLRKEISSDCENGAMIREIITEGMIVPSEITVKLIHRTIESSKNNKFLIDGFPRSDENRVAFEKITGVEPDIVLFFDCPEEDMVKRVLSRNQGRIDDNIETIKKRLKIFNELNLPVINYYSAKGKVHKESGWATCLSCGNARLPYVMQGYPHRKSRCLLILEHIVMKSSSLISNPSMINAIGTEEEVFERVYPLFATLKVAA